MGVIMGVFLCYMFLSGKNGNSIKHSCMYTIF